jgi:predicted naringenin-chalcone synthase
MTWHILDDGFFMTLSPFVPSVLESSVVGVVEKLLAPHRLTIDDVAHWGIHPGGPKIIEVLATRLRLSEAQVRASWHVLAEYGNCSSTTILLVLEEILRTDRPKPGEYGILMAFGPGLTLETALLRF